MSDVAIAVEGLGKRYRIGTGPTASYGNLRESMMGALGAPLRRLRGGAGASKARDFWALSDISFEVKHGEAVGIIGRNGAGKSTLLKVLSRITEPTTGRAVVHGRVGSLLEVGTGFHPELSGRENIYLNGAVMGMSRADIKRRFDEIVDFAGVETHLDTPVKRYSSGMYMRLAFAVAAHLEPEVLVVDEVLAVGDAEFQKKCLGKMEQVSSSGRTVVFVSHNMDSIRKLCTSGVFLVSGTLQAIGAADGVIATYLADSHLHAGDNTIVFPDASPNHYSIQRIEVLDANGMPKPLVHTWDAIRFRIAFHSPTESGAGSVIFQISSLAGSVLSLASTQPDQPVNVVFRRGTNVIDCVFPRLMLSAGTYRIGAGLAIPNVEVLFDGLDAGLLEVLPKDVFDAGLAPKATRYLIPQDCSWEEASILNTSSIYCRAIA